MTLSTKYHGSILVVTAAKNSIAGAVVIQFKDYMQAKIGETAGYVVLDLTRVTFVDSIGISTIVASMKELGVEKK